MKDVRRRLTLLGTATSLALAAAVVTAAPAEARRNVGGVAPETCIAPGHAEIGTHGPGKGATCICILDGITGVVVAGPSDRCPPSVRRP